MGYFDGLVAGSFKQDEAGRTLFFPFGIFGKGRIAPSEAGANALKRMMKTYYLVALPAVILVGLIFSFWIALALALPASAVMQAMIRARVRDWPVSGERLSYAESNSNLARTAGKPVIVAMLVLSLLLTAGGALGLALPDGRATAVLAVLMFGACSLLFAWMLRLQRRA